MWCFNLMWFLSGHYLMIVLLILLLLLIILLQRILRIQLIPFWLCMPRIIMRYLYQPIDRLTESSTRQKKAQEIKLIWSKLYVRIVVVVHRVQHAVLWITTQFPIRRFRTLDVSSYFLNMISLEMQFDTNWLFCE